MALAFGLAFTGGRAARAAGLETPELGAWAAGRGGAVAARPTGGLALQFNPAALAFGRGLELGLDGKIVWQRVRFTPSDPTFFVAGGHAAVNTHVPYVGPTDATLVFARPFGAGRGAWAVGLGAIGPSSTGTLAYPADGPQRYSLVGTDAFLAYYSLGAALRFGPVAAGGTLQLARGSIAVSQSVRGPLAFPTYPDITADVRAGLGWQATGVVGLTAALGRRWVVGLAWRPAFPLGGDGTIDVQLPPALAQLAAVEGNQAHVALSFPHVVRVGLAWRPTARMWVEVDGIYEGWSVLDHIQVTPKAVAIKPVLLAATPLPDIALVKHWHDVLGVRVGVEASFRGGRLRARGGYLFESSAIPSAYAAVDYPNFGDHALCLGGSLRLFGASLDVALTQHIRPTLTIADGQATAVSAPPLPILGGAPDNRPVNNGTIAAGATALAVGLRVPLGRLHARL